MNRRVLISILAVMTSLYASAAIKSAGAETRNDIVSQKLAHLYTVQQETITPVSVYTVKNTTDDYEYINVESTPNVILRSHHILIPPHGSNNIVAVIDTGWNERTGIHAFSIDITKDRGNSEEETIYNGNYLYYVHKTGVLVKLLSTVSKSTSTIMAVSVGLAIIIMMAVSDKMERNAEKIHGRYYKDGKKRTLT